MTRNGKIARLPRKVREQLNQRLDEGEQGKQLVAWLNGLPEVQELLAVQFQGKAINEQNMTEWKQGGFQDWLRHQEALECVRTAAEQARELADEAGPTPLTDVLSASVALLLSKLISEANSSQESTQESRREMLALIREWTALRKGDHRAARLKMCQEDWAAAKAKVADEEAKTAAEAKEAAAKEQERVEERKLAEFKKKYDRCELDIIQELLKAQVRNSQISQLVGHLSPEQATVVRDYIDGETKERQEAMIEKSRRQSRAGAQPRDEGQAEAA